MKTLSDAKTSERVDAIERASFVRASGRVLRDGKLGRDAADLTLRTADQSMTHMVRQVLGSATEPLSAVEIQQRLAQAGFDTRRYSNSIAAIHSCAKRLAATGEIDRIRLPHRGSLYRRHSVTMPADAPQN